MLIIIFEEVAKVFGTPVVMGAPPAQSVSPLTITNNGLEFGIPCLIYHFPFIWLKSHIDILFYFLFFCALLTHQDIVVGPLSIFSNKNSYPPTVTQGGTSQPEIFDEEIVTRYIILP